MSAPPTGTITFLFTDIEGSTRLWDNYPDAMQAALACHDDIIRHTVEAHAGWVFKTVGDAFCTAFGDATQALEAALDAQNALQTQNWQALGLPVEEAIRVRMALHTGPAQLREQDYFGPTLNRVARLVNAGHGGQILMSLTTQGLVCDFLPSGIELRDLGQRRLKHLPRPEQIFQVIAPNLPQEFPPLRTLDARPNNLPAPPTSFVGRQREIQVVSELLRRPDVRLVTLTGPGGTGKTRLSLRVAMALLDEFEDGVFWVALAAVTDTTLLISNLTQTLEVKDTPGQSLLETLKIWLRSRQLLLVLDNFEQLVAAAPLLTDLLLAAPLLKILVSSREVLNLYGEHQFEVPTLTLPDPEKVMDWPTISANEAVMLFVQRAQAVSPAFALTPANAPAVAQICTKLDGLPLAIELAAVRSKQFKPESLLAQLETSLGSLDLLSQGPRDLPTRQRTLRGAIEWSYQLLNPAEKRLFERLAVFVGGWSIGAADAVCNGSAETNALTTIDPTQPGARWAELWLTMISLADKSLLRQLTTANPGTQPEASSYSQQSFMMLQTIREFALEKLVRGGDFQQLQHRHALYFVELAETAEPELSGPQQVEWMGRLEAEHDNLRAALSYLLNSHAPANQELALGLAASLRRFWQMHNYLSEGRQWLESGLAKGVGNKSVIYAKALNSVGVLALTQADYDYATMQLEASLKLQNQLNDEPGMCSTLLNLGNVAILQNNYSQAQTFFEECLILQQKMSNQQGIASVTLNLGVAALYQGNYSSAQTYFQKSLVLQRQLQNKSGIAGTLLNLGCVLLYQGQYEQGIAYFNESLDLFQQLGDKLHIAEGLEGMAGIFGAQMQSEQAARLFGAAEGLRESIGAPLSPSDQLFYEPILDMTRKLLGQELFQKIWQEGRALSLEQALALAMQ